MSPVYNITSNDGVRSSVTVFYGADSLVATNEHPNFAAIIDALVTQNADEQAVRDLFDVSVAIARKFDRLSERVLIGGGKIFFDGDPVDDTLARAILAFHDEGKDDFKPLVNFMEKIATNKNEHSRNNLYKWLANESFAIAEDGDIVAYKGVKGSWDPDDDDYVSVASGGAIVDGEWVDGQVPNKPGSVIELPREEVTFNPAIGCSKGLHVGTWRYARDFAPVTLRVKVNPRDVVSVPTDCGEQKMRVCRYQVVGPVKSESDSILFDEAVPEPPAPASTRKERRTELEGLNRDAVRAVAKAAGIPRGNLNKAGLVNAILKHEFKR